MTAGGIASECKEFGWSYERTKMPKVKLKVVARPVAGLVVARSVVAVVGGRSPSPSCFVEVDF